jgi:hypothetical protein
MLRDVELEANNTAEKSFADRKRNEEAINLRASRKITEEKRKQARLDKALGIFNATVDTAKAVVGFLSDPGGIAGIVLSVAAGITGATQIAKISSEPLPSFGRGGWIDGSRIHGVVLILMRKAASLLPGNLRRAHSGVNWKQ